MNNQDYESKRRECWEEYCRTHKTLINGEDTYIIEHGAFSFAFDCAYALGRETEAITQEEIEKAAKEYSDRLGKSRDVTWNDAEYGFIAGVNFALGKQEKDADTVISGWVARDENKSLYLYEKRPVRNHNEWVEETVIILDDDLFPDLTWESEPEQVEIILKRKKKNR